MNKQLLSLYGLKWNPFSPEIPTEALLWSQPVEHFAWRIENMTREGGFALMTGPVGVGKSVAMRLIAQRLSQNPEVWVRELSRPQARSSDFYREIGDLFGVPLNPHNRWVGVKQLRERWLAHIESVRVRPVVLVDEAQEMLPTVMSELRLLTSSHYDSRKLLTVVLCGDTRLVGKLQMPDLLPIYSRIRARLAMEPLGAKDLAEHLRAAMQTAGNGQLMTAGLVATLAEHAAGNWRALMTMAGEILAEGMRRNLPNLDEKLYLELFSIPPPPHAGATKTSPKGGRR